MPQSSGRPKPSASRFPRANPQMLLPAHPAEVEVAILLRQRENSSAAPAGTHRGVSPRDRRSRPRLRSRPRFRKGEPICAPLCACLHHGFLPPQLDRIHDPLAHGPPRSPQSAQECEVGAPKGLMHCAVLGAYSLSQPVDIRPSSSASLCHPPGQAITPALSAAECRKRAQRGHKCILMSLAYFSMRISSPSAHARPTV